MKNLFSLLILTLLACLLVSAKAIGCDSPNETLSDAQIKHNRDVIQSHQADPLDQAKAIETLMCDKRDAIRGLAIQAALKSANIFVRGKILTEILFQKQRIIIEFLPEENLTNEVKDWLTKNRALSIPVTAYDRKNSCIDLRFKNCNRSYVLDISGTTVDLEYGDGFGKFVLEKDGVLMGEYYPRNLGGSIKAKIRIY